jgi:DNA-binding FrmR family transcriptional regulator
MAKRKSAARNGHVIHTHAAGVDEDIKAANLRHLSRIEGQVRGIAAMVTEDRYCADIIVQTAAVQESLRAVAKNLLKNHLKHCAIEAMHAGGRQRDGMIDEVLNLVAKIAR